MKLIEFIEQVDLNSKSELRRAMLLCFFNYKETQCCFFTMSDVSELMEHSGYCRPNTSRLKEKLIKGKSKVMLVSKINKGAASYFTGRRTNSTPHHTDRLLALTLQVQNPGMETVHFYGI